MKQLELFPTAEEEHSQAYFARLLLALGLTDGLPNWPDMFGGALRHYVRPLLERPIRVLSLFSGAGGLDIAFHDAGFDLVEMIEKDPRYFETLEANTQVGARLSGSRARCMDVQDYEPSPDMAIDFIIGGPPCQSFSAAGRRAAGVSGLDDPRGHLFEEYVRILKLLQPKGFLFENVYGIIGAQGGRAWEQILAAFKNVGYKVNYRIVDAADYGVAQHRERLIIVGTREKDFLFPRPTHGPDSLDQRPHITAQSAIRGVGDVTPKEVGGKYGYLLQGIPEGLNYSFYTEKMGHPKPLFAWRSKFSDFLYKADPERPVRTIKAQGGQYTGPFHWNNRAFSIGELKRLQSFPDDYLLSDGKMVAIQQIGNSVPPQLGRMLAIAILEQVFDTDLRVDAEYLSANEELGFRKRKKYLTHLYEEKAKAAIKKQRLSQSPCDEVAKQTVYSSLKPDNPSLSLYASLHPDFSFEINPQTEVSNLKLELMVENDKLHFFIREQEENNDNLVIKIQPESGWKISWSEVYLHITTLTPLSFTAAWKALEHYIETEGIKADLVQLNGYYQYKPSLLCQVVSLSFPPLNAYWSIVKYVVEGLGVGKIVTLADLADRWKVQPGILLSCLNLLKRLGYEVRSEFTNDQIPVHHILIPYSFPTLNPKSIQLHKPLFPADYQPVFEHSGRLCETGPSSTE